MINISERPAEVEDRAVPSHWEVDLTVGKNDASAVGNLAESTTRFVLLLHLPNGHGPEQVTMAMKTAIKGQPEVLFRTSAWDQGREMFSHGQFTIDTGIDVYFCDPHSPGSEGRLGYQWVASSVHS